MGNIGYPINGVNSHYFRNFVAPSDSLLGIRYVVLDDNTAKPANLELVDKAQVGDVAYYIYENTQALPVGFVVQEDVKDWKPASYNPFQAQNSLFTLMTGNGQPVYVYQEVEVYPDSVKSPV